MTKPHRIQSRKKEAKIRQEVFHEYTVIRYSASGENINVPTPDPHTVIPKYVPFNIS